MLSQSVCRRARAPSPLELGEKKDSTSPHSNAPRRALPDRARKRAARRRYVGSVLMLLGQVIVAKWGR